MRLFVGLILPDNIKDYLFLMQNSIPSNIAKIKWVAKKNLHLTLKFLGEINEKDINQLISILGSIRFNSFNVSLSDLSFFESSKTKGVIGVGLKPEKEVINLQQKIDSELLSIIGFDQEFFPHLTVGRIKVFKDKKKFLKIIDKINVKSLSFEINSFCLIKSEINHNGPRYSLISKFNT